MAKAMAALMGLAAALLVSGAKVETRYVNEFLRGHPAVSTCLKPEDLKP